MFAEGTIGKGLSVAVARYIKVFRNIYMEYLDNFAMLETLSID
jgi:hypothetical protein